MPAASMCESHCSTACVLRPPVVTAAAPCPFASKRDLRTVITVLHCWLIDVADRRNQPPVYHSSPGPRSYLRGEAIVKRFLLAALAVTLLGSASTPEYAIEAIRYA